MSDEDKTKSWWTTLPGIITSLTGGVTAIAGLVVAINQTGWFKPQSTPPTTTSSSPAPTAPSANYPSAAPAQSSTPPASSSSSPSAVSVALPALRDYKVGEATYTLLKAELAPQNTEKDALKMRVRMLNNGRYPSNFWDSSFRLVLDGVPMAPESGLDEVVAAQSAKEGEVLFVVPHGTTQAKLKIIAGDNSTEIPLTLPPR